MKLNRKCGRYKKIRGWRIWFLPFSLSPSLSYFFSLSSLSQSLTLYPLLLLTDSLFYSLFFFFTLSLYSTLCLYFTQSLSLYLFYFVSLFHSLFLPLFPPPSHLYDTILLSDFSSLSLSSFSHSLAKMSHKSSFKLRVWLKVLVSRRMRIRTRRSRHDAKNQHRWEMEQRLNSDLGGKSNWRSGVRI